MRETLRELQYDELPPGIASGVAERLAESDRGPVSKRKGFSMYGEPGIASSNMRVLYVWPRRRADNERRLPSNTHKHGTRDRTHKQYHAKVRRQQTTHKT